MKLRAKAWAPRPTITNEEIGMHCSWTASSLSEQGILISSTPVIPSTNAFMTFHRGSPAHQLAMYEKMQSKQTNIGNHTSAQKSSRQVEDPPEIYEKSNFRKWLKDEIISTEKRNRDSIFTSSQDSRYLNRYRDCGADFWSMDEFPAQDLCEAPLSRLLERTRNQPTHSPETNRKKPPPIKEHLYQQAADRNQRLKEGRRLRPLTGDARASTAPSSPASATAATSAPAPPADVPMIIRSLVFNPESDDDAAADGRSSPQPPPALFLRPRPALPLATDAPLHSRAAPLAARPPCARAESARTRGGHPPAAAEPPQQPSRQQRLAELGLPLRCRDPGPDAERCSLAAAFSAFSAGESPPAAAFWETPAVDPGSAAVAPGWVGAAAARARGAAAGRGANRPQPPRARSQPVARADMSPPGPRGQGWVSDLSPW